MSITRRLTILHGAVYLSLALIGFTLLTVSAERVSLFLNALQLDITRSILHLGVGAALIALGLMLRTSISTANRVMSVVFGLLALTMLVNRDFAFDMPTAALYLMSAVICAHMGFIAHWEPASRL